MKHFLRLMVLSVFVLLTLNFYGCSGDDGPSIPANTNPAPAADTPDAQDDPDPDPDPVLTVTLTVSESTILPSQTTTLTATCLDDLSAPVDTGTTVTFSISNNALGTMSATTATTNASGIATVTFTAGASEGTVSFTATAGGETSSPVVVTIEEEAVDVTPTSITFNIASGTILMAGASQVIQATLRGEDSLPMGQGIAVSFSIDDNNMGTLATFTDATNASGFAETSITAANVEGTVTLTAQVGAVLASIDIEVMREQPATIQFVDVTEEVIATKGSGGLDFSTIRFQVKDGSGNPVKGESVEISIVDGPGGGEYLGPAEEMLDIYEATTDAEGYASAILHSGYVAGPVTIQASVIVDDIIVAAKPAVISIGGGIVDDGRFVLGASTFNLPGLFYVNRTAEISAYLADRYGNYNILDGTVVNFMTEPGLAVYSTGVGADEYGMATVVVRTQGAPVAVAEEEWETNLKTTIDDLVSGVMLMDGHPTNGFCSVMAYTEGEENFYDEDGNGLYESDVDTFDAASDDTYDDPFVDYDGDGSYDGPGDDNPIEDYFDSNNEGDAAGQWDGKNGVCDTRKAVFRNMQILVTGGPVVIFGDCTVPVGGVARLPIYICDQNYNPLTAGTIITMTNINLLGDFLGGTLITLPETNAINAMAGLTTDQKEARHLALIDHSIMVIDDRLTPDEAETGYINVSITWEGQFYDFIGAYTLEGP